MNDKQLESFICIAECGSFNKAEKLLFCSKQALSQRMNALEDELGWKLFERNIQGVILTAMGQEFLSGAKKILAYQKKVLEECRSKFENPPVIRLSKTSNRIILEEIAAEFLRRYKEVKIEPVVGFGSIDECSLVLENMIDIGETPYNEKCNASELEYIKLIDSSYVCLMRKDHPLGSKNKLSWAQLQKNKTVYNPVQYSKENLAIIRERLPWAIEKSGLSHQLKQLLHLMEEGYIFITPSFYVRKIPTMICVPLETGWTREYGLVVRRQHSMLIEQYINLAREIYDAKNIHL